MNTLELIKQYANLLVGAIVVSLAVYGAWWWHHDGYLKGVAEVQGKFDAYQSNIEQQRLKQQADIDKFNRQQELKNANAKAAYDRDIGILTARLRNFKPVLCGNGKIALPVDAHTSASDSKATNPPGTVEAATFAAGTKSLADYYTESIMDLHQCNKLIEYVKAL
jgi:hypothetical protein